MNIAPRLTTLELRFAGQSRNLLHFALVFPRAMAGSAGVQIRKEETMLFETPPDAPDEGGGPPEEGGDGGEEGGGGEESA
jgi:hypothetical protein